MEEDGMSVTREDEKIGADLIFLSFFFSFFFERGVRGSLRTMTEEKDDDRGGER